MKISILIAFIVYSCIVLGQNLVPNGGFESYHQCPEDYNKYPGVFWATEWFSANAGTPDYFHSCSKRCGVPLNWMGNAEAPEGSAYAGIITCMRQMDPNQIAYREYISVQLLSPLVAGKTYYASMKVHLGLSCLATCNGLGMFFTDKKIQSPGTTNLPFNPQITSPDKHAPRDKDRWDQISGTFQANGGEQYLIIGNFLSDQLLEYFEFDENFIPTQEISQYAYFYIDDVQVMEYHPDSSAVSNKIKEETITAFDGSLQQGGKLILDRLYFSTDSAVILPQSFAQLDQLIQAMRQLPAVKIIINGHTDNTGTDEYNLQLSIARAEAVRYYLLSKGISKFRMETKGYGRSQPVADNLTEEGKAKNRRVEIEVIQ